MYLTMAQTRERLGLSRWTITKLIKSGKLRAIKDDSARNCHLRIEEASVERYISLHTVVAE